MSEEDRKKENAAKYRDSQIGGEADNVTETKDKKGNVIRTETGADGRKTVITTATDGSSNVKNIAANGNLTSVRNYNAKGELNGVQQTYYDDMRHTDREYFVNGERQGVRIQQVIHGSSADGVIVTNYKDSVRQGEQRNYKGSTLSAVYNYKDGYPDGNTIEFDEHGRAVACRVYENGEIADIVTGDALRKYDRLKPQKVGEGEYGDIYSMPENDIRGAVKFLAEKQGGEIKGFYHDEDHGSVDLIWNDAEGGLCHMIDKHVGYNGDKMKDFASVEELADEIDFVLHNGNWEDIGDNKFRIAVGENHVVIKKIFDGKEKNWVVTAYEKERNMEEKGIQPKRRKRNKKATGVVEKENGAAANRSSISHDNYGPENYTEIHNSVNEDKDTQISGTAEENAVNSSSSNLNYRSNRRQRQGIILSKARPDLSEEQREGF